MLRSFVMLLLVVFFIGCQNCVCLPSQGLRLGLVSFDSTDVDTIIIRKFEKGNSFTHLVDTLQWDKDDVVFDRRNDTFQIAIFVGDILLKSNYDYKVLVPAVNKTFAITEINEPQQVGDCRGKIMCGNVIQSCKMDGKTTSLNYETLYLTK